MIGKNWKEKHTKKQHNVKNRDASYLDSLILGSYELINNWTSKVIAMILRVRQKIRPGRHTPRISHKPEKKWENKGKAASVIY